MAVDLLLREGRINQLRLRNRILTGPMEKGMANRDGSLTARYIAYLVERARGGASLIQVESTYVDTRGMGHLYQAGCHGDHVIPALSRMAKAVHAEGAKVGLELYMGGRQTPSYMSQRQPIAPSVVACRNLNPTPTPREMTVDDIQEVIRKFVDAARRVVEAGLDMIHLHGSHGYLLCSFLSPYSNHRTDQYGGSLENRSRFALELLAATRQVVGRDFAIGYRMSAEEYVNGGLTVDETALFAQLLANAGIDLIDVSGGIYESFPMIIQGAGSPKGAFVENASRIKKAVGDKVPVSVAQRLNDPDFANEVLRKEGLDFISLTRAFHADPYYIEKVAQNRKDEILPCIACHTCTNLLEADEPAGCAANPRSTFEFKYRTRSARQRRVLIAGGGIAGMHAARILAEQGHRVTLYEASGELGGQMRYASRLAEDYGYLVTWLRRQMEILGVDVQINRRVDSDLIKSVKPDTVVIAMGAGPGLLHWPIRGNPDLVDIYSALDRPAKEWTGRVVIAGGDSESCFVALSLARHGTEVHLVEPRAAFALNRMSPARELQLMDLEKLPSANFRPESTIEEIGDRYVVVQRHGEYQRIEEVSSVVIGGRTANNQLYEQIVAEIPEQEIYNIGDSVKPRDIYHASREAAEVAEAIRLKSLNREGVGIAQGIAT